MGTHTYSIIQCHNNNITSMIETLTENKTTDKLITYIMLNTVCYYSDTVLAMSLMEYACIEVLDLDMLLQLKGI